MHACLFHFPTKAGTDTIVFERYFMDPLDDGTIQFDWQNFYQNVQTSGKACFDVILTDTMSPSNESYLLTPGDNQEICTDVSTVQNCSLDVSPGDNVCSSNAFDLVFFMDTSMSSGIWPQLVENVHSIVESFQTSVRGVEEELSNEFNATVQLLTRVAFILYNSTNAYIYQGLYEFNYDNQETIINETLEGLFDVHLLNDALELAISI